MKQWARSRRFWVLVGVALAVSAGALVPVIAGREEVSFTATPYADVVRFEAGEPTASLQIRIYDLSGRELWDSGMVLGRIADWDRTNEWGERLAYGAYLYQALGWDADGALVLQRSGKLALFPGDKVQLQAAPPVISSNLTQAPVSDTPITLQPMVYNYTNLYVSDRVGIGTDTPETPFHVVSNSQIQAMIEAYTAAQYAASGLTFRRARGTVGAGSPVQNGDRLGFFVASGYDGLNWINAAGITFKVDGVPSSGHIPVRIAFETNETGYPRIERMVIKSNGNVGIGTSSPAGQLDIHNSANQPALRIEALSGTNLIEAYNSGSGSVTGLIFRVERETGNVCADGAFYGAGFYTGGADVAEHIDVLEPVEPGDVVEIDPDNPGHFRKARGPFSRLVAGVVSTNPGVRLGGDFDPAEEQWDDNRPLLALAGRVPVKVTTENGPIAVGDLLVASSKPGYAMRCTDSHEATGMVIGKALEPFSDGEGLIIIQVMLR